MLSSLFDATTIGTLEQVLRFTEARHGVLAGNIANINTPGYKSRDLSPHLFQQQLREAIDSRREPPSATRVLSVPDGQLQHSAATVAPAGKSGTAGQAEESIRSILYHDGTDVSLEKQISAISKNQSQHNMALGIMVSQFQLLRAAISERVG